MKKFIFLVLITLVFSLSSCNIKDDEENVIYVTVYPMRFLVEAIAGDQVVVKRVPGSQVHSDSIDWAAKDIIDMINSDIIFYVDGGLDGYIKKNADSTFKNSDTDLVNISEVVDYNKVCLTETHTEEDHDDDDHTIDDPTGNCASNKLYEDPHFWIDPVRMLQAATFIKDRLIEEYPKLEADIIANYSSLETQLITLHSEYKKMALEVTKPIITTSLLFNYYNARYDIEILSMATTPHSIDSKPGDTTSMIAEAKLHDIHYILYERNVSSNQGDSLFNDLGQDGYEVFKAELHGLGNLTNEEVTDLETYLTLMYDNLEVLKLATK
jgi:zinc transport system substrate-binding protein